MYSRAGLANHLSMHLRCWHSVQSKAVALLIGTPTHLYAASSQQAKLSRELSC